jgi:hypothetical protein
MNDWQEKATLKTSSILLASGTSSTMLKEVAGEQQ